MFRATSVLFLALAACNPESGATGRTPGPVAAATPPVLSVTDDPVEMLPEEEIVVTPPEIAAAPEEEPMYAIYTLRRGETLAHFARWSGVPVEEIAEASGLDLAGSYAVGTELRVPVATPEQLGLIDEARESHREVRVEGYLASRGGSVGTDFVKVRTGDSAWKIAQDNQGIPVWVLEAYNPSVDLDALRPGQELMVPVLADVVVDAANETPAVQ
jgi:LysM repeat protein